MTLGVKSPMMAVFMPVTFIADSGNDVTLINMETARLIGLAQHCQNRINVGGIGGTSSPYCLHRVLMRIGASRPFPVTVAVGSVRDNLLGRHEVFDRFRVTFEANRVSFSPIAGYTRCCGIF